MIERIDLTEISLVDRPANPEAVIDVWKADAPPVLEPPACAECGTALACPKCSEPAAAKAARDLTDAIQKAQAVGADAISKAVAERDAALQKAAAAEARVAEADGKLAKVVAERDHFQTELAKRPKGYLKAVPISKAADVDGREPDGEDEPLGTPEEQARAEIRKLHAAGGHPVGKRGT